jgi:hypothetical protein
MGVMQLIRRPRAAAIPVDPPQAAVAQPDLDAAIRSISLQS